MDDLVTVAAITLLVVAIHAAFAVYFYRSLAGSESDTDPASRPDTDPTIRPDTGGTTGSEEAPGREVGTTVRCPTCGIPNDGRFQFCRRCVSDLSDTGNPKGSTASGE